MTPLVLVHSFGQESCDKIMKDILRANGGSDGYFVQQLEDCSVETCKLNIATKYYTTEIALFKWDDIESIPSKLKKYIEGCIIYFDSVSESLSSKMDTLTKFVNINKVGLTCLLTRKSSQNAVEDKLIRKMCASSHFAIIDLNDQDDCEGYDDQGYGEVVELLKNNIWSNVVGPYSKLTHDLSDVTSSNIADESFADDSEVEKHLNEFEDLLNNIQQFKTMSQNLNRDELLNNAERLAEHFAKILGDE
ncbi:alpha- and gamma-adaptin-binding protein p34 [Musca autumnalis]|uniref:alpha- and gamma-adaptin-binding protein p34 n=1 Tax=Musca autumnalis TaxID=221902 RepID=UPI003CF4EA2F